MIGLIPQILQYRLFRRLNFPQKLPLSLTLSLTNQCNCRCKTCFIYDHPSCELSSEEILRTFKGFGRRIFWLTLSGGEPFLRKDLDLICVAAHEFLRPSIINIPTNALLTEVIYTKIEKVLNLCRSSKIIVNLSLDGWGDDHDRIRGVQGSFEGFCRTYKKLRELKYKNLHIGINTTLSKYNAGIFHTLIREVEGMAPDSFLIEYAQERFELNNNRRDFSAAKEEYGRCVDMATRKQGSPLAVFPRVVRNLRSQYYELTQKILLENKRIIPCFAGFSSAHISSEGDVWACGIRGDRFGNLREENYDFQRIWFSKKAQELRKCLRGMDCFCVGSNITYQNMLFNARQLNGFLFKFIKESFK